MYYEHNGRAGAYIEIDELGFDLPDPPDNLDFLDLFTPAEQDTIAARFETGIRLHNQAMHDLYARSIVQNTRRAHEAEAREVRRGRILAARFNPVLRVRPSTW